MLDLSRPEDTHIDRRLRTETIIWLASSGPDGRPHLVPLWFLWDGATILLFSLPETRKLRNVRRNPAVVLSLEAADQGYDVVIVEGRATLLDDPNVRGTMPAFVEKYAGIPRRWEPEEWARKFSQTIRVTPTRVVGWVTKPGTMIWHRTIQF